jgi:4-hydroxy-tetrahydrodipicolinate synthase
MNGAEDMEQMDNSSLRGVFAAALTPMGGDLDPDRAAFVAHCRRLLDTGCHGLGVFGTTGEANSLSVQARLSALEALIEGGVPGESLLPGTGSCVLEDTTRLSRAALEAGSAGVLVLPPFYYKDVSDEGVFRFFASLIEQIGDRRLRVYLYHFPQMTGVGFGLPLIGRLLETYPGVVVGMKDSAGDWERIEAVCREFPGFSVFAGTERYLLDTLRHGGAGCISATVNVTSRLARQVYDAHEAAQEDADILQERLTGLRATIEAYPLISVLKHLMQHYTHEESWSNLRPPLCRLTEDQAQDLLRRLPVPALL